MKTSSPNNNRRLRTLLILVSLGLVSSLHAGGTKTTITTFDAPGAGTTAGRGTFPSGMNASGNIVGFVRDANAARHGFLRARDGTFTTVDDPAAGTCSASCGSVGNGQGTRAYSINSAGQVVGFFTDTTARCHGFVRGANGAFTQIDAPDAGSGPFPQGTFPSEFTAAGINSQGAIEGFYVDAAGTQHGFVRAPNGNITEFDPPGSIFTNPNAIDEPGDITGFYFDANFVGHGFLRSADGTITSFDAPGADMTPGNGNGTFGVDLTPNGEIEGIYVDASGVLHGFIRSKQGAFSTFDVQGAGTGPGQGTIPEVNNNPGSIVGNYTDSGSVNHGFVLDKHGNYNIFNVPGTGTGASQGTIPLGNNNAGAIAGEYIDGSNVAHGFVVEGL